MEICIDKKIDDYDFIKFIQNLNENEKKIITYVMSFTQQVINYDVWILWCKISEDVAKRIPDRKYFFFELVDEDIENDIIEFLFDMLYFRGKEFDILILSILYKSYFWKKEYIMDMRKKLRKFILEKEENIKILYDDLCLVHTKRYNKRNEKIAIVREKYKGFIDEESERKMNKELAELDQGEELKQLEYEMDEKKEYMKWDKKI